MNPRSIRVRLTAWNAVFLMAVFALAGATTWFAVRDSLNDTADDQLRSRLVALEPALAGARGGGSLDPIRVRLAGRGAIATGTPFRVASGGRWVFESPDTIGWGRAVPDAGALADEGGGRTIRVQGNPVRVFAATMAAGDSKWVVEAGIPVTEFYETLDELAWLFALGSPLALLLAGGGGYWMSRRALEPVDAITMAARSIGADNLARRLPLRGVDDELDRLSATLNDTFSRLEEAFLRTTQFTADASHELRTPVAIVRTAAEVARQRPRTTAEYAATLDRIVAETDRMSQLIDDLLLLARQDASVAGPLDEPVDLAQIVGDAYAQARATAAAAGLTFVADIPRSCLMVGNPQALRRLVTNLLDNAANYTPRGGTVTVRMSVHALTATIEVRDTGVGIRRSDLTHIFERFYRTDADRSRETGGSGLGLAIAQTIAARHGGTITAESAVVQGSVFRIELPIAGVSQ